ncbi:MAG: hypothetical protein ACPG7F_21870 [Aggregatilineales bacterium]
MTDKPKRKVKQQRHLSKIQLFMLIFASMTLLSCVSIFAAMTQQRTDAAVDMTRTHIANINATTVMRGTELSMTLTAAPITPTQMCFFVWHVPSREQDEETLPALLDDAGITYSDAFTDIFWGEDQICGDEVREALVMRTEYHVTLMADAAMMSEPVMMGGAIADVLAVLENITPNSPAEVHIHFENGDARQTWKMRYENAIANYQYGLRGTELFQSASQSP